MVVRNKYGGYWNKTRSTVDSGGSSIPCMISVTNIFHQTESPLISPYHAIPDRTVPTETGSKLIPTQGRGFPRFPAGMHARHMRVIIITSVFISNSMESITCTHAYDHITWNNKSFEMRWCYKCINDHSKNIMPGFRMLAFNVWKARVLSKLLKVFFSFPKILFESIFELTHISKTEQKKSLNFFQINLKIN